MSKRVRIYYMTQAAVAPPTFVLFTDRDVKLHFSYERFLANEIRDRRSSSSGQPYLVQGEGAEQEGRVGCCA